MTLESDMPKTALEPPVEGKKAKWMATGGVLAALGASSCCIVPLILFSLGISGAWVGNLTQLAPYKPIFIVISIGFLGYGFYMVYRKPKCADGAVCARPLPNRLVKFSLWGSTAVILTAIFWTWIAPVVAPIMLGL